MMNTSFSVELHCKPSTGYKWEILHDLPSGISLICEEYSVMDSNLVGGTSIQKFLFENNLKTSFEISFGYMRSFEDKPPIMVHTHKHEVPF